MLVAPQIGPLERTDSGAGRAVARLLAPDVRLLERQPRALASGELAALPAVDDPRVLLRCWTAMPGGISADGRRSRAGARPDRSLIRSTRSGTLRREPFVRTRARGTR